LLLLDEPTNYLDILSIRWLREFLRGWSHEMIIITHDRDFMDSVTTHTMGIHRCHIRKIEGSTDKLYSQLLMEEEMYERTRINDEKKRAETEKFINRFRVQATKARAVQSKIKALEKRERMQKLEAAQNLEFTFPYDPFEGKWLMTCHNLSFSYEKELKPLIDGFSIAVGRKDRIAIIGKNGKGKTTLLNLLAGDLKPDSGDIECNQKTRIGYFGQTNIERLDPGKTVEQEVLDVQPDASRRIARTICGIMLFEGDDALKKVNILSGGEKSRVLLAKILVSPSNLLLLDEPTNHLDLESVGSLLDALDAYEGAVIIVTHSEMILNSLIDRLIIFDNDKVTVFEGTYDDFLNRIGWISEEVNNSSTEKNRQQDKLYDRRELRRIKAELINERSKALGMLKNLIDQAEGSIVTLEQRIQDDTEELVKVSGSGDWQSMQRLSKSIHDAKEEIDTLFRELEILTEKHSGQTKEYDERLASLEKT
jgi:ATP-binding cassette subfamily F protein 3